VTLLQVGSATSSELARLTGIGRTTIYPVLEELRAKRLAESLPGSGVVCWSCPGRDEVVRRRERRAGRQHQ